MYNSTLKPGTRSSLWPEFFILFTNWNTFTQLVVPVSRDIIVVGRTYISTLSRLTLLRHKLALVQRMVIKTVFNLVTIHLYVFDLHLTAVGTKMLPNLNSDVSKVHLIRIKAISIFDVRKMLGKDNIYHVLFIFYIGV